MVVDPISPITPARVSVILLPLGKLKKHRFDVFVGRLREENIVRLGDITPDALGDKTAFSPLAFPNGLVIYDLSTSLPAASHAALSPFETFREPLIALCIGDGAEYEDIPDNHSSDNKSRMDLLHRSISAVTESLPRLLLVQPVLFDASPALNQLDLPNSTIFVPRAQETDTTNIKTVMCDISARFLAELSTLARSIQVATSLPTPAGTTATGGPPTAKDVRPVSILRTTSLRMDSSQTNSPLPDDDDVSLDGLAPLSEVTSAPADMPDSHDSRPQSPSIAETSRAPSTSDMRPPPQQRQVSRDSSVDSLSRREMSEVSRQPSLKRRSLLRGGPSPAELAEQRLKARQTLVIGSLYLQAGRWSDALRELSDGTVQARSADDHFWHAKGLENLLVTMLMLASSGMDFQIPLICQAGTFKMLINRSTSGGTPQGPGSVRPSLDTAATLMRLGSAIPDLCRRILDAHIRGFSSPSEVLSRYAFSESIVRLARLLTYMQKTGGVLSLAILEDIVFGTNTVRRRTSSTPEQGLSKVEIAEFVFRAFPAKTIPSPTTSTDAIAILSAISAILGDLGLSRKQAVVNKELLAALVPAVSQARGSDLGAVGDGSGSTRGSNAASKLGLDVNTLMEVTGRAYALLQHPELDTEYPQSADSTGKAQDILQEIFLNAKLQSYGSLKIKLDMLKLYSDVSENITNYGRLAQYTAAILEVIGPRTAARSSNISGRIRLPREEQIRYMTKVVQTSDRSESETGQKAEGRFWDPFLVRRVEVQPSSPARRLIPHSARDLNLARRRSSAAGRPGPFLHDPFLKSSADENSDVILVEGEEVEFIVTMQNLYDFEVILESVCLFCQGVTVRQSSTSAVMPPSKLSRVKLTATPTGAGKLDVLGCRVKVQGCSEEDFFLFEESWAVKMDVKTKGSGVSSLLDEQANRTILPPSTKSISYQVLATQPVINKVSTSLPQATVAVLDGERRTFKMTVHNESRTTAVDFLHISFQHNLAASDTSSFSDVEQYELDHQRVFQPILSLRDPSNVDTYISPGSSTSFDVELLARSGLQNCSIVVDYAHLGASASDVKQKFYTRQVTLPIAFATSPSMSLKGFSIIPDVNGVVHRESADDNRGMFHLVLDVHNSWTQPLTMHAQNDASHVEKGSTTASHTNEQTVMPDSTSRISIALPKLAVDDATRPIPTLSGTSERQFVVNKTRRASVVEMNNREIFWYREELLRQVKATWVDRGGARSGELDLRGIMIKPRMLEVLRQDSIKVETTLASMQDGDAEIDCAQDVVRVDETMEFKLRLTNLTQDSLKPYLVIEPELISPSSDDLEVDVSQCLAWTGQFTQTLDALPPRADAELHFGMTALCAGQYTLKVSLNDIGMDGAIGRRLGGEVRGFVAC